MPVASIDGGEWQLESIRILADLGFSEVSRDDYSMVSRSWQGVVHRPDSLALFWGAFSLAGDCNPSRIRRLASNFLRSFVPFYMFLLIKTLSFSSRMKSPGNFGDQFVPLEERLARVRGWIGAMHERFREYRHLYSGMYFEPFAPPPAWAAKLDRVAFWLGMGTMIVLFPLTVVLVAILAIRNRL